MAGNNVEIVSSYMKYNTKDVEQLLKKMEDIAEASEEEVRNIVKDWMQEPSE